MGGTRSVNILIVLSITIFLLTACRNSKFYKHTNSTGLLKTCDTDSTSLFASDKIEIYYRQHGINENCPGATKDEHYSPTDWPAQLYLDLKAGKFNYRCVKYFKYFPDTIQGQPKILVTGKLFEGVCHYRSFRKILT